MAKNLRQERAKIHDRMRALEDLIAKPIDERPAGMTNAAIDGEYVTLERELKDLESEIETSDQWARRRAVGDERHKRLSQSQGFPGAIDGFGPLAGSNSLTYSHGGLSVPGASVRGRTYAAMFAKPGESLSNDGFPTFGDWLAPVVQGTFNDRLRLAAGEKTGSGGGYIVPEQYAAQWLDSSLENEIVRPLASIEAMTSEVKRISGFDSSSHSGGTLLGGITSEWLGEGATGTPQTPKFHKIELRARKLGIFTSASNELVEDGTGFEQQLAPALTMAAGWSLDDAFLNGTGAGQPRGVLNDVALIAVDARAGQAADTIIYENLVDMLSRLHPACFSRSVWVANPTTIPWLLTLSVSIGDSGSHVPVMTESNGQFRMLTRPVLFTEKLPALGDQGDLLLADFSQYVVGMRREVSLEKSVHVYWSTDTSAYRAIVRVDGQGKWKAAFTPKTGATQSWCVTLAAR